MVYVLGFRKRDFIFSCLVWKFIWINFRSSFFWGFYFSCLRFSLFVSRVFFFRVIFSLFVVFGFVVFLGSGLVRLAGVLSLVSILREFFCSSELIFVLMFSFRFFRAVWLFSAASCFLVSIRLVVTGLFGEE